MIFILFRVYEFLGSRENHRIFTEKSIDIKDPNCIANIYQKNMGPKKSKVKKPKVKRSVTQPAKSIIERTICAHLMTSSSTKARSPGVA